MPESPSPQPAPVADWESFYRNYRKPGYVQGFEITSKLGGGMFGLVFKATRQSIGKDYAIKFLRVDDGEVRRAVLAELAQVEHFAQVDHPNLVSIEDRGEVDGIPYLVMAFAGAQTLRDRLPGELADRDELVQFFLQVCRGTGALHAHSLVHFDLKPANVFLKGGVARVGDYGLSKLVTHSRGSLSMGRGTPYYMAPEMLESRGDHRSDIYSLGVMLYEVLCGDVPFKGENEWEVLRKHENAKLDFPDHVGARERAVVERCMAKDPADRFQAVADLIDVLGAERGAGAAVLDDARLAPVWTPPLVGSTDRPPVTRTARDAYAEAKAKAREAVTAREDVRTAPRMAGGRHQAQNPRGRTSVLTEPLVISGVLMLLAFTFFAMFGGRTSSRDPIPVSPTTPVWPANGDLLGQLFNQAGLTGVVDEAAVRQLSEQLNNVVGAPTEAALRRAGTHPEGGDARDVALPEAFRGLLQGKLESLLTPAVYTEVARRLGQEQLYQAQLDAAALAIKGPEAPQPMERMRELHQKLVDLTGLDGLEFVEDPEQVRQTGAFWLWFLNRLTSMKDVATPTIEIKDR